MERSVIVRFVTFVLDRLRLDDVSFITVFIDEASEITVSEMITVDEKPSINWLKS